MKTSDALHSLANLIESGEEIVTADVMLRLIDDFFLTADATQSTLLADVLSAIRGPDDDSLLVKEKTTAVIRNLAFPRTAQAGDTRFGKNDYWFANRQMVADGSLESIQDYVSKTRDFAFSVSNDSPSYRYDGHFWSHVERAIESLGDMGRSHTANEND